MANSIDLREVSACTCLRLRAAARQLTQLYDQALAPAGLTVNQFGLLARLYGATRGGSGSLAIGALAERLGMHPTTLNRDLKPLKAQGLVADARAAGDRRLRPVTITGKGSARLRKAIPFWQSAQRQLEQTLGADATRALNGLIERVVAKLKP